MICSRRRFLGTAGVAVLATGWPRLLYAQGPRPITLAHSVSTFVYGQHLVAREKKFFEDEGVRVPSFLVPGGGAKVAQVVAAGQAMFGLGDSNHPLKITEKGKDAVMLFATDTRCSYANVVARKALVDRGLTSVEQLADVTLVGRRAVVAATAIGSGTHVYGNYVLKQLKAADGKPVNDHVEWVGGRRLHHHAGRAQGGQVRRDHGRSGVAVGGRERGLRRSHLRRAGREGVEAGLRRQHPHHGRLRTARDPGEVTRSRQAYVNACYRAQQWMRKTKDDEIVELIHRPYMETFRREDVLRSVKYYKTVFDWDFVIDEKDYENGMKVWVPLAVDRPIPYAKAADMSYVRKAHTKHQS